MRKGEEVRKLASMAFRTALVSVVTLLLWNYLVVDLTGCKPVGIWQAFGLAVLGRTLTAGHRWMAP